MEGHHLQRIADALSELSEKVMFLAQSGIIVEGVPVKEAVQVEGESGVEEVEEAVEVEDGIQAVEVEGAVSVEGKVDIKAVELEPGIERARIDLTLAEANSNTREVEHSSFGPIDSLVLATSMQKTTTDNYSSLQKKKEW